MHESHITQFRPLTSGLRAHSEFSAQVAGKMIDQVMITLYFQTFDHKDGSRSHIDIEVVRLIIRADRVCEKIAGILFSFISMRWIRSTDTPLYIELRLFRVHARMRLYSLISHIQEADFGVRIGTLSLQSLHLAPQFKSLISHEKQKSRASSSHRIVDMGRANSFWAEGKQVHYWFWTRRDWVINIASKTAKSDMRARGYR
jgi:hypothetical protein